MPAFACPRICLLALLSWLSVSGLEEARSGLAWAQMPAAPGAVGAGRGGGPAAGEAEPEDPALLPPPLNDIRSNVDAFAKTGYLQLVETQFRPGGGDYGSEDAVVWTFRTKRPITCRHLELLLKSLYDVRIYDTAFGQSSEVYRGVLAYPSRIHSGAVDGRIVSAGEYVDVWLQFRETDIRRLISLRADQLVFRSLPPVAERRLATAKTE